MKDKNKSILIVEDEKDAAFLLSTYLTRKGYEVEIANNLKDAYNSFEKCSFPIVLLDLNLPDGSGFDFLKWLNKTQDDCKVIINSAFDDDEERARAENMGVSHFLSKPTDFKKISSVL